MIRRNALLTATLILLAGAADARAGTLIRSGSTVTFTAHPGEENRPTMGASKEHGVRFNDAYTIDPGPGCTADATGAAGCPSDGVTRVVVKLGDEDDVVETQVGLVVRMPEWITLEIDGGAGEDEVYGTANSDVLSGGAGDDEMNGGGGRDVLSGNAGKDRIAGFGRISGGDGDDFIQTFDSLRDKAYPSKVKAGAGRDRVLTGNREHDDVDCGPGRDRASTTDYRSTARRHGFKPDRFRRCE